MIGFRVRWWPLRGDRVDRVPRTVPKTRSAALRGAAVAVLLVGTVGSVVIAEGWESTVRRQRDERLDRTAA
jgi:hypothetical protein